MSDFEHHQEHDVGILRSRIVDLEAQLAQLRLADDEQDPLNEYRNLNRYGSVKQCIFSARIPPFPAGAGDPSFPFGIVASHSQARPPIGTDEEYRLTPIGHPMIRRSATSAVMTASVEDATSQFDRMSLQPPRRSGTLTTSSPASPSPRQSRPTSSRTTDTTATCAAYMKQHSIRRVRFERDRSMLDRLHAAVWPLLSDVPLDARTRTDFSVLMQALSTAIESASEPLYEIDQAAWIHAHLWPLIRRLSIVTPDKTLTPAGQAILERLRPVSHSAADHGAKVPSDQASASRM